jgi:hypothetical protein
MNRTLLLILTLFLLVSATHAQAPITFEHATVAYRAKQQQLTVTIAGEDHSSQIVRREKGRTFSWYDTNPLLIKVNEMTTMGWEVFNTSHVGFAHDDVLFIYDMRRPMNK